MCADVLSISTASVDEIEHEEYEDSSIDKFLSFYALNFNL
ncbi:hypothetical protein GCM10010392_69060 [Streptomyces clavifer]|nr:hypothetical protein GCM10010392_69060 [Streptomyces clavifer]